MTRQEFITNVTAWSDLHDFMRDIDFYDDDEDYYDLDGYRDAIWDDIGNSDGETWEDLRDGLDNLPSEDYYAVYIRTGWLDYRAASQDEFPRYKEYVLEYADECECWDEPEEEESEDPFLDSFYDNGLEEENDEFEVDESFDPVGFSTSCAQVSAAVLSTVPIEEEFAPFQF